MPPSRLEAGRGPTADLLAGFAVVDGDFSQAGRLFEQALALYRETDALDKAAATLSELSNVAALQNRLLDSLRYDQEALTIYRQPPERK